jgi:hypothetical protein
MIQLFQWLLDNWQNRLIIIIILEANNGNSWGDQVLEGYEIINALTKVGKPHQDGEAFQRISFEGCGVLPSISNDTAAGASMACSTSHASMHGSHRSPPQATAHRSLQRLASLMVRLLSAVNVRRPSENTKRKKDMMRR